MRILSLAVRDFRGVRRQRVELAEEGVTILEGPNEIGKTSLAEALEMLFERRDSSTAEEVREAQPLGRDVGPEVEVEARCGDYRFRYRKRYIKGPETVLEVSEPAAESLTGREAHDRVEEILAAASVDRDLWRALRVVQGTGLGQPADLTGSPSLMEALSSHGGDAGDGTGKRQVDLHAAVGEELGRYFTEARHAPTGELKSAREELAEAEQREAELAGRMAELEADAERASELAERRVELRGRVERGEREAAATTAELKRVSGLEEEVSRHASRLAERETLRDVLEELAEVRRRADALESRRRVAGTALAEAEAKLEPARREFNESRRAAQRAEGELERRRERAALVESLAGRREALAGVDDRLGRARQAAARAEAAEERLAAIPEISAEALAEVEEAARHRDLLAARIESGSPTLQVTARDDLHLEVEGEDVAVELGEGQRWQSKPGGELRLALADAVGRRLAELALTPGADTEAVARELEESEAALTKRLGELGLEDLEAARSAHRRRTEAAAERKEARSLLSGVAGDAGVQGLEARRAKLSVEVTRLEEKLSALAAPGDVEEAAASAGADDAGSAVVAAREALAAARKRQEEAQGRGEELRTARDRAERTFRELEVELRSSRQQRSATAERAAALLRRHGQEIPPPRLAEGGEAEAGDLDGDSGAPESGNGYGDGVESDTGVPGGGEDGAGDTAAAPAGTPGPGQLGLFAGGEDPANPTPSRHFAETSADPLPPLREAADAGVVAAAEELAAARRRLAAAEPEAVRRRAAEAEAALTAARDEQRRVDDEHLAVRTRLDHAGEQGLYESLEAARGRLAAARRVAASTEARAAAADRLRRAVESAREEARQAYAAPLAQTLGELGRPLFGDDFAVELDDDLNIARRTAFGTTLDYARLSSGAQEQLSLLLRLACAVLVSPREGVPLILDDALGYSDRDRLAALGDVLSRAGQRCQVIVLTCYPSRYEQVAGARRIDLAACGGGPVTP